jgi:XTP/dITP diphosphohydrolase
MTSPSVSLSPLNLTLVTENPGKASEWQRIGASLLPHLNVTIWAPPEPVEETGTTFIENARLKAMAGLGQLSSGCPSGCQVVVGEDAGLIVPGLSGQYGLVDFPGVLTNRWLTEARAMALGVPAGLTRAQACNEGLLRLLPPYPATNGIQPLNDRSAYYVCALFAQDAHGHTYTTQQTWQVTIAHQPAGDGGFGYDPIMLTPDGRTVAEWPAEAKNAVSHRAQAIAELLKQLTAP